MFSTTANAPSSTSMPDDFYDQFLLQIQRTADKKIETLNSVFTTSIPGEELWRLYINASPPGTRQSRTCNACRRFIERFGGLAVIAPMTGMHESLLWSFEGLHAPPMYRDAREVLARAVERSPINGVFVTSERVLGIPVTEPWHHISLTVPEAFLWRSPILSADQRAAALREEHHMLARSLAEFKIDTAREAASMLTSGRLFRSEKCIGVAKWFLALHESIKDLGNKQNRKQNLIWLAAAQAPPGYCHVRSSMIGTLLEDIESGFSFDLIKSRFDTKMDPTAYQRPVAPPTAGNIKRAEEIVDKLGIARSLERRFARLSDVKALWTPPTARESSPSVGGVFSHLRQENKKSIIDSKGSPVTMTWVKFLSKVLPSAEKIELLVPRWGSFTALVTATHPDAPPVIQWDRPELRNTVSWYVYSQGSHPRTWNLSADTWTEVAAIVLQPSMWDDSRVIEHQGQSVNFLLKGARDCSYSKGAGLFPEQLRSELREVRSTIEAYWRTASITGGNEPDLACGIRLQASDGLRWDVQVRVTSKGVRETYRLDRWD